MSILNEYHSLQSSNLNFVLLFKIGAFYEIFGENAIKISQLLGLTLTDRYAGEVQKTPMCGIPIKSKDFYIAKLLELNFKIAIADERIKENKIIAREVVRILTPGTNIEECFLANRIYQNIVMINKDDNNYCVSLIDLTIGNCEIYFLPIKEAKLNSLLLSIDPTEIITDNNLIISAIEPDFRKITECVNFQQKTQFEMLQSLTSASDNILINLSNSRSIEILNLYCIFEYIKNIHKKGNFIIKSINRINTEDYCEISLSSFYGLEILKNYTGEKTGTLFNFLSQHLSTQGGKRTLKSFISRPSTSLYILNNRLDLVEFLINETEKRKIIKKHLKELGDIDRSLIRFLSDINAREESFNISYNFNKICSIFYFIKEIKNKPNILSKVTQKLEIIFETMLDFCDIFYSNKDQEIEIINFKYLINRKNKPIFDNICGKIERKIEELQNYFQEISKKDLKIKLEYNAKYTFHIEVLSKNIENLPDDFIHLSYNEKYSIFSTDFILKINNEIVKQIEHLKELEMKYILEYKEKINLKIAQILEAVEMISVLDILLGFADISEKYNYTRPIILEKEASVIELKNSFHSILRSIKDTVSNDCNINEEKNCLVITGVNMGGKSTFLKQNGLLIILAQIGCFVPAEFAKISIVDKIFTRIGAIDAIKEGKSTFYLEMLDIKEMITSGTKYSLCLLDEVCIGTSYKEGLIILQEILKYLSLNVKSKIILSTHYHEIQDFVKDFPNIETLSFGYKMENGNMTFLFKLSKDKTKNSYPLHTIKMTDFPKDLFETLEEKLSYIK